MTKRKPDTPLRFEVSPGIVVAHDARTVLILEATSSSKVRVRDVVTGSEQSVPVSELSGIAGGLSRRDILNRWSKFDPRREMSGFMHGDANESFVV